VTANDSSPGQSYQGLQHSAMNGPDVEPSASDTPDGLPPLSLPRSLLDRCASDPARAMAKGLVSVRLGPIQPGRIHQIHALQPPAG